VGEKKAEKNGPGNLKKQQKKNRIKNSGKKLDKEAVSTRTQQRER